MKSAKKILMFLGLTGILAPAAARAEFHFYCGEGREKGLAQSEIAFVDSLETAMKFYLNGQEVPEEKLGFKAMNGGQWIVSVDRGAGRGSRKFLFSQKDASVQEFSVEEQGGEKKVGGKKKCEFRQEEFREESS